MSYRVLTKNGIYTKNVDDARNFNFNSGRRSGIIKGALNEGNIFSATNNVIALDTCELRLCGHRVVIDSAEIINISTTATPTTAERIAIIAEITVLNGSDVNFRLFLQDAGETLEQDNLDKLISGVYQLEIGRFSLTPSGEITDIVRTADLITGGIGDDDTGGVINIGNVTTNTLDAGMEAEVDIENRYSEEEKKTYTDFTFSIPQGEKGAKGDRGITGNGISKLEKTATNKLVDTYTITFTDGNKTTFTVTNGKGITSIAKTSTSGLVDTYTITFNDATTTTFTVTNGLQGLGMYRTNTALTTSSTSVAQSTIAVKPSKNWQAGDMILDPNGLVFAVTDVTALTASTIPISYRLSIKGAKGDKGDKGDSIEIYQTTGTSTTGAMSQNATTTELAKKFNSGYGTCSTASATSAKVVTIADTSWKLKVGTIIGVKFTNSNSASNVTLNVNNTGAKSIWYNNAKYTGNGVNICGSANIIIYYMYDGTYWVWLNNSVNANTDTIPAISWTVAGTANKIASYTSYQLLSKSYFNIVMVNSNTAKSKLTLNVNGKGAKTIYINGKVSSETNYTLPAGSYIVYYDGTNYYFNTDGTIYGQQKFYDWVATDITLTTSTSNATIDLSQHLPSTSGDEEYEILVQGYFENSSGTVGSRTRLRLYTDKIGSSSAPITIAEGLAQVKSVTYVSAGNIIVPIHRYLYTMPETLDSSIFRMYGYRRIK